MHFSRAEAAAVEKFRKFKSLTVKKVAEELTCLVVKKSWRNRKGNPFMSSLGKQEKLVFGAADVRVQNYSGHLSVC